MGDLTRPQLLEGVAGKEEGDFFVITKNSNWEILPKNLVTFKGGDGIKDEKL